MTNFNEQSGKAIIAWIVVLAVTTLIALRLLPIYIEAAGVRSSLKGLETATEDGGVSVRAIRAGLQKRFDINNIDSVQPEDISIVRERGVFVINIDYEVRVPFVANVDFIVSFENSVEVPAR